MNAFYEYNNKEQQQLYRNPVEVIQLYATSPAQRRGVGAGAFRCYLGCKHQCAGMVFLPAAIGITGYKKA